MTTILAPLKYTETDEYVTAPGWHCPGCSLPLSTRYLFRALGNKVVVVGVAGCGHPPLDPNIGNVNAPLGSSAIFASGIKSGLVARGDTETTVITLVGDGATFDIGLGGLSGAAERNEDILYVCHDNEGYQNTGNQRSSASPWKTINTTNPSGAPKPQHKKDIMAIMAGHAIPYAATATVGFPDDFIRKAQKARTIKGFRFMHILCPCSTGWGFPSEMTMEISRLAVDTKLFPLFEVENGVNVTINRQPKGLPISTYTKSQLRFKDFTATDLLEFEEWIEQRWNRLQYLAGYKQ